MRFKLTMIAATVVLVSCAGIGTIALATPASDPPPTRTTTTVTGILDGPTKAKQDGVELKTKGDTKVVTFELTYPIGSYSGWHSHPGIVIAVVKAGIVVRKVGCKVQTFTAGQSFTEAKPHFVSNFYTDPATPHAEPAVLEITQIYPADERTARVEQSPPSCPHGVTKD
jgi:hypothetical protein